MNDIDKNACKEVLAFLVYKHFCKYLLSYHTSSSNMFRQDAFVAGMCCAEAQKAYVKVTKGNSQAERAGLLSAFHATMEILKNYAR